VDWFAIVFVLVFVGAVAGLFFTRGRGGDDPLALSRDADHWVQKVTGRPSVPPDEDER
jgi:hypothetical protein